MSIQKGSSFSGNSENTVVEGLVFNWQETMGNVGTTPTYITPTNPDTFSNILYLKNNGDSITLYASGHFSNTTGTAIKRLQIYLLSPNSANGLLQSLVGNLTVALASTWVLNCVITRVDNITVRFSYEIVVTGNNASPATYVRNGVVDFDMTEGGTYPVDLDVDPLTLYLQATNSGVGTGDNETTCDSGSIFKYISANVPNVYDN
jgi:hypothetical protein